MEGWIKLHRSLTDWHYSDSPDHFIVFITLLLRANFKETTWRGIELKAGQVVTGRKQLSLWTGVPESRIRSVLRSLKDGNEIDQQITNKFSIITILNWHKYQGDDQQITINQPSVSQQVTTSKNVKNVKNVKNNILSGVGIFEVEQPTLEEVEDKTSPAIKILNAFNIICGKGFRPTAGNLKPINARLKEGYDYQDFIAVIEHFNKLWSNDPKFSPYLQPTTIFNTKFDGRLEQTKNANIERLDPLDVLFGSVTFEVANDA